MLKRTMLGLGLFFLAPSVFPAETNPADLVVFPGTLPPAPAVFDDSSPLVVRWDRVPHGTQEGVKLIPAAESAVHSAEAMMAYDSGGGETLLVHVLDDARVMAPATRMSQERLLGDPGPFFPGVPAAKPMKITIHPLSQPSLSIDGYLTRRDPREPLLVLVIPDKNTGEDRFTVNFTWLAVREDRAEVMAAWLQKAAATINIEKLQSLP